MAKTLKQILDGVKSSKLKTKDILGTKPGVDYSPKAGDERKFADKHHVDQHADRVGNGSDVYSATNVKSYMDADKAAHHGYKAGEDEKVYEAFDSNIDYGHDKHALDHAAEARTHHVLAARSKHMKDDKAAQYHQDAAGAHHMADLAHHLAKNSHSSGSPTRHDDSVKAHKASKDAHKLSDIAYLGPWNTNEEVMALRTEEKTKCNKTKAGVECPVHGMKNCLKEDDTLPSQARTASSTSSSPPPSGTPTFECNMSEAGKMCEVHGMKACPPKKMLKEKPVKEEVVSELLVQNYVSGSKGKSAEVHKNMNAGTYSVKKMVGSKLVSSSEHDDSASAHAAAKKHLGEGYGTDLSRGLSTSSLIKKNTGHKVHFTPKGQMIHTDSNKVITQNADNHSVPELIQHAKNFKEEVELDEKALAKSKQTMLVTAKGTKSAGGVMRIKKSEYDPKIHSLAEGDLEERKMTSAEMDKREHIVKGMKKKLSDFRARYGKRAKDVMYATATKQAMKEDLAQPLIGSTDPTKNKKGKKKEMEQSAPAVTPITLPNFSVDVNTGRNV